MASLPLFFVLFVALIACGESRAPHQAHDTAPQPAAAPAELNAAASEGETVFNAHCAQCHGPEATGTNLGPTLIDRIYHPGHHGDAAFHLAVLRGVRQHHWQFGNMLPVPGVSETQVNQIICYVRHLQLTAGIFTPTEYQPTC
ncbi:MAG: cytochrome c [Chloroflexota bacterium]|nr:cytochrome c [Chloroflexota bacterium]MDE2919786.1 cytochrome c [Chloroflexota bacterium]